MNQPTPLRVLIVEDREEDLQLILHALRKDGFELMWANAQTEEEFQRHLNATWDIILSDYTLPGFDAPRALTVLKRVHRETPFVVVTGSISEEIAVECMKQGATDYLLKDRLTRLGPAVRQALEQSRDREERRRVESELKAKELQLLQSQKMEAIGLLAGGIAHDFNNVLTIIVASGEMLQQDLGSERPELQHVDTILGAVERASSLTHQLLAFSRKQILKPQSMDLNDAVRSMETMLQRIIPESIVFLTQLDPGLPPVYADPGQISQVLLNLVLNARDAMPNGGRLSIASRLMSVEPKPAGRVTSPPPGSYVELAIADSGIGMDQNTLDHIFEPFFTTKEPGKGTGLGLSTVYGVVTQSQGHLQVESSLGNGTTFHILLPPSSENVSAQPSLVEEDPVTKCATVLLVEDEEVVRGVLRRLLERRGLFVIEAQSGLDAQRLLAAPKELIDIVITDMVMPEVNGIELAEFALASNTRVPVIIMSGYLADYAPPSPLPHNRVAFLNKPFTATQLFTCINEIMGRARRIQP